MADTTETTEVDDRLDGNVLARSLTGFDQLAIRERFRAKVDDLAQDDMMFARALLFIHLMRGGAKSADAYSQAMCLGLDELQARFVSQESAGDVDEDDEDAVAERDRLWAEFVIGTGLSYTVDQFQALTLEQRSAVIDAHARLRG